MEILKVGITSIGSVLALFIMTKLMGYRQISQMSVFDYIVGITIGSIASELAISTEKDFYRPLIAMAVFAVATIILAIITNMSIVVRRLLTGETLILLDNKKIYKENLAKAKMDISEFLAALRDKGFFSLSDIETAVLESNGKISVLAVAEKRPINPEDMQIKPQLERPQTNVILDGKMLMGNLAYTGNNEKWLQTQLKTQDISCTAEVMVATCDCQNVLHVFKYGEKTTKRDIFE